MLKSVVHWGNSDFYATIAGSGWRIPLTLPILSNTNTTAGGNIMLYSLPAQVDLLVDNSLVNNSQKLS